MRPTTLKLLLFGIVCGCRGIYSFAPSLAPSSALHTTRCCVTTQLQSIEKDTSEKNSENKNKQRRKTRRAPTPFKHLFRHNEDISIDCWLRCAEPREFMLSCGYTEEELDKMAQQYPKLLDLDVHAHLAPKVRFIVKTLGGGKGDLIWAEEEEFVNEEEECDIQDIDSPHKMRVSDVAKSSIPPEFFGLRLERHIGPRHAYLQHFGLPSGPELFTANGRRMKEFMEACSKKPPEFAMLAMRWAADSQRAMGGSGTMFGSAAHTAERVETFEEAFRRGLLAAARSEGADLHTMLGSSPGRMADLLINHGANYLEHDKHGASMLHWAAGTGNLDGTKAILEAQSFAYKDMESPKAEVIINTQNAKDGATPLHWAAAGVDSSGFGKGGHANVCRYLLETAGERANNLANAKSFARNTPLMWSAWAGSLDVLKLLASYGADPHFCNSNGCNSAHWAASGGNLDICKYLYEELNVDFARPDNAGYTPLDHAINFGQENVVDWILQTFYSGADNAAKLLQDEKMLAEKYIPIASPELLVVEQLQDAMYDMAAQNVYVHP